MKILKKMMFPGVLALSMVTMTGQATSETVNFSSDMESTTGWSSILGSYTVAAEPFNGETGHYNSTAAVSERHGAFDTNVDITAVSDFTFSFRTMLHNQIAAVNEAVARVGLQEPGSAGAAGQITNAWVTLRRVGSIELTVQVGDGLGGTTTVVNTASAVDGVVGAGQGLSGYNYADWTVTRNAAGEWSVAAVNASGDTVVDFGATESTVATSSNLSRVWINDFAGQWNGAEASAYYSEVSVTSNPIPEPASLLLVGLGSVCMLKRHSR